jgi:hypothetical protein
MLFGVLTSLNNLIQGGERIYIIFIAARSKVSHTLTIQPGGCSGQLLWIQSIRADDSVDRAGEIE